jgi:outer membrane protein OmpA-like peptidoglycan-associated protein
MGVAAGLSLLVFSASNVRAAEDGETFVGVDLGVVQPLKAFNRYSNAGGMISPYAGYMFHKNFGLLGSMQVFATPQEDRPGILDDDATWVFTWGLGPKISVPLGDGEMYGTWQGGTGSGLAPNSSITDTSFAMSTGGGINAPLMGNWTLGAFGRWNRLYQRVHGEGDAQYVTAGVAIGYNFRAPEPAPAPPPVAQAPPPPPPPAPKKKIVLRGVNFDFNKADIRSDARPVLDAAIDTLKAEGGVAVIAEGHTDSIGSDEFNQRLSVRRANAVRDYLIQGGISASRISIEGFGESKPVASNETADGRAQNRRVELRVTD